MSADFSLHKKHISLHVIEFQKENGDIKKEKYEGSKSWGVVDKC